MHIRYSKSIELLKNSSIINFLETKTNQKTHLTLIILNYHISATCRTILKINFRNFQKSFVKKVFTSS